MAIKEFAYQSPTGRVFAVLENKGTTFTATLTPVGKEEFIRLILDHEDAKWISDNLLKKIDQDAQEHLANVKKGLQPTSPGRGKKKSGT